MTKISLKQREDGLQLLYDNRLWQPIEKIEWKEIGSKCIARKKK